MTIEEAKAAVAQARCEIENSVRSEKADLNVKEKSLEAHELHRKFGLEANSDFLEGMVADYEAKGKRGKVEVDAENATITIADYVSFWEYYDILLAVKQLGKQETLTINIASGGGSAFAGMAIRNLLQRLESQGVDVEVNVDGLAASAAALIFLGVKRRKMGDEALLMFHLASAWLLWYGDVDEVERYAANVVRALRKINESIISLFAKATGVAREEAEAELNAGDVWLTAEDAQSRGIMPKPKAADPEPTNLTTNEKFRAFVNRDSEPEVENSAPEPENAAWDPMPFDPVF